MAKFRKFLGITVGITVRWAAFLAVFSSAGVWASADSGVSSFDSDIQLERGTYLCTQVDNGDGATQNRLRVKFLPRLRQDRVRIQSLAGELNLSEDRLLEQEFSRDPSGGFFARTVSQLGEPKFLFTRDLIRGEQEGEMQVDLATHGPSQEYDLSLRFFCARRLMN